MTRSSRLSRRLAVVTAVALSLSLVPGAAPASAAWRVSVSAPANALSVGTLVAPVTSCTTVTTGTPFARISWPAVTGATGYRVVLGNTLNSSTTILAANHTGTSFDVTGSLLGNLVAFLGSLLTGGSVFVTVTALHADWASPASNRQNIVLAGTVVSGLGGGVRCQTP